MQILLDESGEVSLHDLVMGMTRIGRSPACDIVIPDSTVSRVHATLEQVGDHHILEDQGSTNGTFLNGTRIPPHRGFVLRHGDRIEISRRCIVYGVDPLFQKDQGVFDSPESSYPVRDLLAAAESEEAPLAILFRRELASVSSVRGLEDCLRAIARELEAECAAIFVPHEKHELEALAAIPSIPHAEGLAPLAKSIMASDRGRIVRPKNALMRPVEEGTFVEPVVSMAAVPVVENQTPFGVLALERRGASRFRRPDLVRLAVMAARLGEALSATCSDDQDTRFGFGS